MQNIHLLKPRNGVMTAPLQLHSWPDGHIPKGVIIDRSQPKPVQLAWKVDPGLNVDSFTVEVGDDEQLITPLRRENVHAASLEIKNLFIGKQYFWKVIGKRKGKSIVVSNTWSFTTNPQPPRWIQIPEITNVRDIGGWPLPGGRHIRQGLVLRSSEMNSHLSLTNAGQQILEQEFKIRSDIDLRGNDEVCTPALDIEKVAHFNFPIQPYAHIIDPVYQTHYRELFHLLADPACYPVIIHCWGGADRTGTVAFLLEALLGMEEELLVRDYELTSLSIWGERDHTNDEFQDFLKILQVFGPSGADLRAQSEGYLLSIGVSIEEINAIRTQLIE
jgi:protein-tyrosine phosphatase